MKHVFKTVMIAVTALIFTACSNNASSDQNNADGDTIATASEQTAPAAPILTEQGLAPVVIGANIKDLPEAVEGLYARKEYVSLEGRDDEEIGLDEVEGWYFYDKDGQLLFTAEDNEGAIFRVIVKSPDIKTAQGAHVGMSRDEALKIEGAKLIEPDPEADYMIYCIELGKISMTLDMVNSKEVISMEVFDYSAFDK